MKNSKLLLISLIVILPLSSISFANENLSFLFEAKVGNGVEYDNVHGGFGFMLDYPIMTERISLGFETGIIILSNWADTLDLRQSPNPEDTLLYDIWTKNGTDIDFFLGPSLRYRLKFGESYGLSCIVSTGGAVNVSAYDEIKKSFSPPPLKGVSKTPAKLSLYLKPKVILHLKKVYVGYEFFGLNENLEHLMCIGITF